MELHFSGGTPDHKARSDKPLFEPRWKPCSASQCSGVALTPYGRCLRHLDLPELDQILQVSRATGNLDGRGVYFCPELLERIYLCLISIRPEYKRKYHRIQIYLAAAPEWPATWRPRFDGARFGSEVSFVRARFGPKTSFRGADLRNVTFSQATFGTNSSFSGAYIEGGDFVGVHFGSGVIFDGAVFSSAASFYGCTFFGSASFQNVNFNDEVTFGDAEFEGSVAFARSFFGKSAVFRNARFHAKASFVKSRFGNEADFSRIHLNDNGDFQEAKFELGANFRGANFIKAAYFNGVAFDRSTEFGPLTIYRTLYMRKTSFAIGSVIDIKGYGIDASESIYLDGITMRLGGAQINLREARFGGPSIITTRLAEDRFVREGAHPPLVGPQLRNSTNYRDTPRLVSLQGADVANLRLNGVDLRSCFFGGTHNLESLQIEGPLPFAQPPRGLWSRRSVIAEEHWWRHKYEIKRKYKEWSPTECRPFWQLAPTNTAAEGHTANSRASAAGISATYRALRKGLEDTRNEPGAADFYYGEMEMRRKSCAPYGAECALLTAYWLSSGYGLRALRALGFLAIVVVLATIGFLTIGFGHFEKTINVQQRFVSAQTHKQVTVETQQSVLGSRPGWSTAATFSLNSTTSLLAPQMTEPMTDPGRIIELAVRILAPTLFGLCIFSLRGRIKR